MNATFVYQIILQIWNMLKIHYFSMIGAKKLK